eukprot:6050-Heterococcus_DN1.PRE.11
MYVRHECTGSEWHGVCAGMLAVHTGTILASCAVRSALLHRFVTVHTRLLMLPYVNGSCSGHVLQGTKRYCSGLRSTRAAAATVTLTGASTH